MPFFPARRWLLFNRAGGGTIMRETRNPARGFYMAVRCDVCGDLIDDAASARLIGGRAICGPCHAKLQHPLADAPGPTGETPSLRKPWREKIADIAWVALVAAAIVLLAGTLLWMLPPVRIVVGVGAMLLFHSFGVVIVAMVVLLVVLIIRRMRARPAVDGIARVREAGPAPQPTNPQRVKTSVRTMLGIVATALTLAGVVALIGWILALPILLLLTLLADSTPDRTPIFLIPLEAIAALLVARLLAYVGQLGVPKRQFAWSLPELALRLVGRILMLVVNSAISVFFILCLLTVAGPSNWWAFIFGSGVAAGIGVWFLRRRPGAKPGFNLRSIGSYFLRTFLFWCAVWLAIGLANHVWPDWQRW